MKTTTKTIRAQRIQANNAKATKNLIQLVIGLSIIATAIIYNVINSGVANNLITFGY